MNPTRGRPGSASTSAHSYTRNAAFWLFAASLALHVALRFQYGDDPFRQTYVSDALSYHEQAARWASAGAHVDGVFHQAPLFPWLLSLVYRLAPDSSGGAAILLNSVLTSLGVALLAPLGRLYLGSTRAGVLAGVLALLHGPLVFHSMKLLPVSLAVATQATALLLLGLARRQGTTPLVAAAGAATGAAAIARSEMLLLIPLGLVMLLVRDPESAPPVKSRGSRCLSFGFGVLIAIGPVTAHNLRNGDLVAVASSAGENLFIGNQRGADGGHTALHPKAGDLASQRVLARQVAETATGRTLRPSEISAYWRSRALTEIAADPPGWLGLELRKLGRLLHPGDPTDMYSFDLERGRYLGLLYLLSLPAGLLWPLAIVGIVLALGDRPSRSWPWIALIVAQAAVLMAFFVSTRLRLPLLFLTAGPAGLAVSRAWELRHSPRARPFLAGAAALAMAVVVAVPVLFQVPARERVRLSSVLSRQDRLDESLDVLRPGLASASPDALLLDQAGWIHHKRGEWGEARDRYVQAIETGLTGGRRAQTQTRLGLTLEKLGLLREAAAAHDEAVASGEADAGTYFERAAFRARRGDRSGAVADLREAARLDPDWPAPREALRGLGATDGERAPTSW